MRSSRFLRSSRRLLAALLLLAVVATPVIARLDDTLSDLKKRFGDPAAQPRKDVAVWFFEIEDGRMSYTVTFNAQGRSIAEGIKPIKRALFTSAVARNFIDSQLAPYQGSKTMLLAGPGEKYKFAGQEFTGGEGEYAFIDEPNKLLIVWTKTGLPSVMAVRPEMLR
jgi:hypothetical protein